MTAYCVPKAVLKLGQSVPRSPDFFKTMTEEKKAVEKVLESARPCNLPKRESVVYLFEDENKAKKWAARKKRPIYLVELEQKQVQQKADWCWLGKIAEAIKNRDSEADQMAQEYWQGKSATDDPWWELLVDSATIVKEITLTDKERNQMQLEQIGISDFKPNSKDYGPH